VSRAIPIGRVAGVPVRVGLSWVIVIPLVGLALFAGIQPALGTFRWRIVVTCVGTILMFGSVLFHELGHLVAARRRGIPVEQVLVFLFGGYTEMDLEDADPLDDVAVSVAGPVASGMLAAVMMVAALLTPEWAGARRTLAVLGLVNIGVAVFNLLPGFPLDGGRILRAALMSMGMARHRAAVITARFGIGLGVAAVAGGAALSVLGDPASVLVAPVGALLLLIAVAAYPRQGVPAPGSQSMGEEI
jgi:Zn-dependent protease